MSSKLQVAALTGLIVGGAALWQNSIPCLANSASLRYLRAEYKLVTGDAAGAMRLMQQPAQPQPASAQAATTTHSEAAQACSRMVVPTQIAAHRRAVAPKARVLTVSVPVMRSGHLERLTLKVPSKWTVQHAQMLADIQARAALQNAHVEETMRQLEAKLRNLPVPPAAPVAPSAFSFEPSENR